MNTTNLTPLDHFYHKVKNHFVLDDDARKDLELIYKDAKKLEAWNAAIADQAVSNNLPDLTQDKFPNS